MKGSMFTSSTGTAFAHIKNIDMCFVPVQNFKQLQGKWFWINANPFKPIQWIHTKYAKSTTLKHIQIIVICKHIDDVIK